MTVAFDVDVDVMRHFAPKKKWDQVKEKDSIWVELMGICITKAFL